MAAMGGRGKTRSRGRRRRIRRFLTRGIPGLLACALLAPAIFYAAACLVPFPAAELDRVPLSTVVCDREGRVLRIFRAADDAVRIRTDPASVSPHLVAATLAIEDRRFFHHPGVDPLAVGRALLQNVRSGRIVSGASTITMQVVRLLHPRPRTIPSKLIEAFRALALERRLSKREILGLYLTLAPYGGDLYGAEAAARAYFGRRARDLSLAEAALLAGIPQSPARLRPDRFPDRARERRDRVLDALARAVARDDAPWTRGMPRVPRLDLEAIARARKRPVRVRRHAFPFRAPHFAQWVAAQVPAGEVVRTTLDLGLQVEVEGILRRRARALLRVHNAAAVLLENDACAVRAYVGSPGFWSRADRGQVDGARAIRSPGSALKPFVYALAYQLRRLGPSERLADVPLARGPYEPVNFDRAFRGLVPAGEALAASLNVPAVRLLERVGVHRVAAFLRRLGLETIGPGARHGAALALGGCGVRLLDFTAAYATIARDGIRRGLRWREDAPGGSEARLLAPEACWLVARALIQEGEIAAETARGAPRIALKTGTSWGRRDAWAMAFTPRFTVGVWLGNFDGRPSRDLVGARAAAPAARAILERMRGGEPCPARPRPAGIREGLVCAETGLRPGPHCPHIVPGPILEGDARRCTVHRAVPIDRATGSIVCGWCARGRSITRRVLPVWPSEVEAFLVRRGKPPLPPHLSTCPRVPAGRPRIVSPAAGATYAAGPGAALPLRATAAPGTQRLYWFIDGALLACGEPGNRPVWRPPPGPHTVTCRDDRGRQASVRIRCRARPRATP